MMRRFIRRIRPWRPRFGRLSEFISMELSGSVIKLAHGKVSSGRASDVTLFSRDISGLSDGDISRLLKGFLAELKLKQAKVISVIPSHVAITKNIEIPSRDHKEIREIVNLQAGRHTPYSREEIIVDYLDIGTYKNSYTKVLLVMVTRNIIKRQFDIMVRAGLKVEKMLFAPEAAGRFISLAGRLEGEPLPSAVLHVDESFTDFMIVFKGRLLYIRSIPIGHEHLTRDASNHQPKLIEEIKNSLENYQTEGIDKMPGCIILTGITEDIKAFEAALSENFPIPSRGLAYLSHLQMGRDISKSESSAAKLSFLNAAAGLFAIDDAKLNLVPEEVKLRKAFEEKSREIVKAGILALITFVLVCFILISNIYFKSAYLNELDEIFRSQYKEVEKLEDDFDRVKAVRDYIGSRGYSLEVLTELYTLLSDSIMITDIRFEKEGRFAVKGTARTMASIFALVDSMEKSDYFKDVGNRYATKRKEEGEDVADFEIVCELQK